MFAQILAIALIWQTPAKTDPNHGAVVYLVEKGQCDGLRCQPDKVVGHWDIKTQTYHALEGGKWQQASKPPIEPPGGEVARSPTRRNDGVDKTKLKEGPPYSLSNKAISADEAYAWVLTDDSLKQRLTIIGTEEQRKAALASLPEDAKSKYLIWTAAPDHWSVKNFHAAGTPTIILQEPSGHILARAENIPADFNKFLSSDTVGPDVPISLIAALAGLILMLVRRQ